ncbi:amidohydrolase family protein [Sporosarcina sp. Sa2YVA2]|uniref:Amidohydrolase family protein n=1 Tax=Sporosarcina quadrami TaxID=2762234 RepID=A0ABR8U813_9BACL|nr:amidohydrolase [Sporosarcina quadrami]MBD7984167.1 amidohydrolase family protein [Sporosarcina quadrami]
MSEGTWLTNVKLEIGERQLANGAYETETALFHIQVKDGRILEIKDADSIDDLQGQQLDMSGKLAIPPLKEMHNHLDKTYMALDWKAVIPVANLKERLELEALELVELADSTEQRATKMIETLLKYGVTHIRTHVNIDPYIGLKNLEGVKAALEAFKGIVTHEIVAFPQHGLLRNEVPKLMREAMRSGATMVGGLDPAGIDQSIEKSLHEVMTIATEFDADVDIHLHDGGSVGYYTADKWIDIVEEAGYKGRTALSHSFCLGDVAVAQQEAIAKRLADQDVAIMSTVPINLNRTLPPIELLDRHGIKVHFGCDGFYDSWSPYGTGDVLEKVTRFSELNRKIDERSLRYGLKYATAGITPLDKNGVRVWPKENDEASFVFFEAASTAEVVARKPQKRWVMVNGKMVSS